MAPRQLSPGDVVVLKYTVSFEVEVTPEAYFDGKGSPIETDEDVLATETRWTKEDITWLFDAMDSMRGDPDWSIELVR